MGHNRPTVVLEPYKRRSLKGNITVMYTHKLLDNVQWTPSKLRWLQGTISGHLCGDFSIESHLFCSETNTSWEKNHFNPWISYRKV